jgi:hypothetical protein
VEYNYLFYAKEKTSEEQAVIESELTLRYHNVKHGLNL